MYIKIKFIESYVILVFKLITIKLLICNYYIVNNKYMN